MITITATAASAHRDAYQAGRAAMPRRTASRRSGVAGQSRSRATPARASSISMGSGMLDPLAQPAQCAGQAGLDGALRDAERRRRLLAVQLQEVAAGDDLPVALVQLVDQVDQTPSFVRV